MCVPHVSSAFIHALAVHPAARSGFRCCVSPAIRPNTGLEPQVSRVVCDLLCVVEAASRCVLQHPTCRAIQPAWLPVHARSRIVCMCVCLSSGLSTFVCTRQHVNKVQNVSACNDVSSVDMHALMCCECTDESELLCVLMAVLLAGTCLMPRTSMKPKIQDGN